MNEPKKVPGVIDLSNCGPFVLDINLPDGETLVVKGDGGYKPFAKPAKARHEAYHEILAHLIGDYILQTDAMATKKTGSWAWALAHGIAYTVPFLAISRDPRRLAVVALTHAAIDRLKLAKYVVAAKNAATDPANARTFFRTSTGYRMQQTIMVPSKAEPFETRVEHEVAAGTPAWMAVWLYIIADNTLHLLINHLALRDYGE